MAVLKSWCVILFYFITQFLSLSYGVEKEEIEKSIDKVLSLQGLATGYPVQQNLYEHQNLNNHSLEDLQEIIEDLYDQLECGYLYGTQWHLKLTRDTVFNNAINAVTTETIEDFSFDFEATMMIDSFLDKHNNVVILCSNFLYARQMHALFWAVMKDNEVKDVILKKADDMLSVIENRIADMRCAPENSFNMAQSSGQDNVDAINTIRKNKQLLHKNLIENRVNRLFQSSLWLFRDKSAFESFFNKFLAGDSDRFEVQFPGLDSENNLTGIAPLGQYQNRVIGTLKIIMLQITLSYTDQLEWHGFSAIVEEFKTKILNEFQRLLVLENDADFNSCIENYSINEMIMTIKTKNDLPEIKSIVTDGGKTSKDIFEVGLRFVDAIQKEIGEIPIRAVQAFLDVINQTVITVQ